MTGVDNVVTVCEAVMLLVAVTGAVRNWVRKKDGYNNETNNNEARTRRDTGMDDHNADHGVHAIPDLGGSDGRVRRDSNTICDCGCHSRNH